MSALDREKLLAALRARQDREDPHRTTGLVIIGVIGGLVSRIQAGEFDAPGDATPTGILLAPTKSIELGTSVVDQCAQCGTLVVWPPLGDKWGLGKKQHLDECPSCGHPSKQWWRQTFPVGPFREQE